MLRKLLPILGLAILLGDPVSILAERPIRRAWTPSASDPSFERSLSSRAASETTWVRVHLTGLSPCPGSSVLESGQTVEEVWCFEGAGGDSSWPANPPGRYSHWSKYDPPEPQPSKWQRKDLPSCHSELPGGASGPLRHCGGRRVTVTHGTGLESRHRLVRPVPRKCRSLIRWHRRAAR